MTISSESLVVGGFGGAASATVHDHIVVGPDLIGEPAGARGQGDWRSVGPGFGSRGELPRGSRPRCWSG